MTQVVKFLPCTWTPGLSSQVLTTSCLQSLQAFGNVSFSLSSLLVSVSPIKKNPNPVIPPLYSFLLPPAEPPQLPLLALDHHTWSSSTSLNSQPEPLEISDCLAQRMCLSNLG